jgi:uncharacterized delta-60 repeat protein
VAGYLFSDDGLQVFAVLARYNANGTLDTTFGDGTVTTFIGDYAQATALALQIDNRIVVAGSCYPGLSGGNICSTDSAFFLARYNINGTLDSTFGGDGIVVTNFGETSVDRAHALAIHPRDGRVVVAGSSAANYGSSAADFALARYHAHTCGGVVVTQINARSNTTVMGTSGNDVIFDFGHDNRIYGLEGNDHLCSLRGTNVLSGGSGNNYLHGGSGTDTLDGGTGTDRCDGGAGSGDTATACETVTNVP